MGHCDEVRDSILGRLKVGVLIIVVIIIVVINNFAPGEQRVSCAGGAAKSVSRTVTRLKQRVPGPGDGANLAGLGESGAGTESRES